MRKKLLRITHHALLITVLMLSHAWGGAIVVPDKSTDLSDLPATACTNQYLKGNGTSYACADAAETDPVYSAAPASGITTQQVTDLHAPGSDNQVKATGAEVDAGTDDAKFATAKALSDQNVLLKKSGGTLTGSIDFATYKAVAMACDNGATVPTSPAPVVGQWFLHTPTGRKVLMQYDGSAWIPIVNIGNTTIYVDKTDGTDAVDKGGAVDSGAFKTIQYAIDSIAGIVRGHVYLYVNGETYAEAVVIKGKNAAGNYAFYIYGTLSSVRSASQTGSVQGATSTQGSISDPDNLGSYDNKLIYSSNNAEYRLIDSDTADTATIVNVWTATPTGTYTIYDWATIINSLTIVNPGMVVYGYDLKTASGSSPVSQSIVYFYRCSFNGTTTHSFTAQHHSYVILDTCYVTPNVSGRGVLAYDSVVYLEQSKVHDSGKVSASGVYLDLLRSGPQRLDRFGAELRWKPPSLMPPVLSGILVGADSSMPHRASYRPVRNEDALHCNV